MSLSKQKGRRSLGSRFSSDSAVVDAAKHYINPAALDAVGRMGGQGYASTRDYFDLPTMSVDTWRADPGAANARK